MLADYAVAGCQEVSGPVFKPSPWISNKWTEQMLTIIVVVVLLKIFNKFCG